MQTCAKCGTENTDEAQTCVNCGTLLTEDFNTIPTNRFSDEFMDKIEAIAQIRDAINAGGDVFTDTMQLVLKINLGHRDEMVILNPGGVGAEMLLGREIPKVSTTIPYVDFANYEGYLKGVSRAHARLSITPDHYLTITDLSSSNGTFVNGFRLPAHTPHNLRDSDLVQLGKLEMKVFFR